MPDAPRDDLRALGYLGAAPIYHTDLRLSKDVIETLFTDAGMSAWTRFRAGCWA